MAAEAITVEWLVTSPQAFGLTNATPLQRAVCRAVDGRPLGDLATNPDVIEAFGGAQALAALPNAPPFEVYLVASTRSAKSIIGAAIGIKCALTCDLTEGTSDGDTFELPILATKKKKARIIFRHLKDNLFAKPMFKALMVGEPTTENIRFRRPSDGKIIDIWVTAGARAGASSIGVWCVAVVLDECARMVGEDDAVVNFDEQRRYALSRIRPGGQLAGVTSPWAPMGPIYKIVEEDWSKPSADKLVVRGKGPQMNPTWWTPKRCAQIQRSDPIAYVTDVLGEFADPVYSLFTPAQLKRAARIAPDDAPPQAGWTYGAAMDPATRGNAFTLVITGYRERFDDDGPVGAMLPSLAQQALARQWQGSPEDPARAKVIFPEMKTELERYGLDSVMTDQWGYDPFREHAADAGIELVLDERTSAEKVNGFRVFENMVKADPPTLEIHPTPLMRRDLLNTRKKLTPEGLKIDPMKTADGRHADYSPASERSLYRAMNAGITWVRAMNAVESRGGDLWDRDPDAEPEIRYCELCKMNFTGPCPKHGMRKGMF